LADGPEIPGWAEMGRAAWAGPGHFVSESDIAHAPPPFFPHAKEPVFSTSLFCIKEFQGIVTNPRDFPGFGFDQKPKECNTPQIAHIFC